MLKLWLSIKVFIKGMVMGAVNVFPISSGTISLVLDVYERFINAINSLRINNLKLLFKGEFRTFARRTDFKFLFTIAVGVIVGMVLAAIFLKQTLKSYEVYTWSFFIGLILASVVYVAKRIEKVNARNIMLAVVGMALSFFLSIKANPYSNDSFLYLFLCGVVGATGMIVPGVSGSHLMLLMGNYELIVTEAIPSMTKFSTFGHGAAILAPFLLGALVSLVAFSHLLSWLMRDYRDGTLAVLAGFMLGSLPVVYPWKEALGTNYVFDLPPLGSELLIALVMVALGAFAVYMLEVMARHTEKKQAERLQNPKPKKKRHAKKTKKDHV